MEIIIDIFSFIIEKINSITNNFIFTAIIIGIIHSILNATSGFISTKLKYINIDHSVEFARWRRELSEEEANEKISKFFTRTIVFKIIYILNNIVRFYIIAAIFTVSLNPMEHLTGIEKDVVLPLLFIDNIFVQQTNFILPVLIIIISFLSSNIGRPKQYWTAKALKPQIIGTAISAILYIILTFISAQLYFVILFVSTLTSIIWNTIFGIVKNNITKKLDEINAQIEKEQKEYEESHPEKFPKIDESAFKEA